MLSVFYDLAVGIALYLHLLWRILRGVARGDTAVFEYAAYRQGGRFPEITNTGRPCIWFHGVSVGEVASLDPVIAAVRARQPDLPIAVSTMTSDGLRTARKLANQPDIPFIYPIDVSWQARRVVEKLRPAALVIIDGDFWFQMLRACRRAGVPVIVINGKLSERSLRRYYGVPLFARELFANLALVSAQSKTMADRFARFIDPAKIVVDGNVKLDAALQNLSQEKCSALYKEFAIDRARFCFVFGSIHPAEIDSIRQPIRDVLAKHPEVQIVIAPRHPDKFSAPPIENAIWINRLGVLRDLYQLCDAAFVGGTFCEVGGHNLAEPVLAGKPVIYGPHVHSQIPLHEILQSYEASMQIETTDELRTAMIRLIEDRELREKMARAGEKLSADSRGLAARLADRILQAANVI